MCNEWESGTGRDFHVFLVLCCFIPSEANFANTFNVFLKIEYVPEHKIRR